jgi:hypothetical protein
LSCRELMDGETLLHNIKKDAPIFIDDIDSPYAYNETLKATIYARGVTIKHQKKIHTKRINKRKKRKSAK